MVSPCTLPIGTMIMPSRCISQPHTEHTRGLSLSLSLSTSISVSVCLFLSSCFLPIHLCLYLSSLSLSFYLSVYLSVSLLSFSSLLPYLPVCVSVCLFHLPPPPPLSLSLFSFLCSNRNTLVNSVDSGTKCY